MQRPYTFIDLFAGCGGLTQGFVEAGFAPTYAVEHDPSAATSYLLNHGAHVKTIDAQEAARGSFPRADLVIGGPPCQGFSSLGKRDAEDPRNEMWRVLLDVVRKTRPAFFVIENVPAFLRSRAFEELQAEMGPDGLLPAYRLVYAASVNAADFGAAQVRRRAIVIGSCAPVRISLSSTHARPDLISDGLKPWLTVRDVIGHLPAPGWRPRGSGCGPETFAAPTRKLHDLPELTDVTARRYSAVPPGGSRLDLPDELQYPCWRRATRGSGDVLGRLRWEQPAVTLRAEFHKPEKGRYLHPDQDRGLTLREGALLQGFSEERLWFGAREHVARQIGNAVPVPLAAAVARTLRQALV